MSKRSYLLGLTGSVGMGKSTTAAMFEAEGCPVWDADAAVHNLYDIDGAGVKRIRDLLPQAVQQGRVNRSILSKAISTNPGLLGDIENAIHPLVEQLRQKFISRNQSNDLLVFDVPLLFETGSENRYDGILVVTAPADTQKKRVMSRPDMTEKMMKSILERQMPDAEKRERADYVISTANDLEATQSAVRILISQIRKEQINA